MPYFKLISSKHVQKSPENFSLSSPFREVCPSQGQKLPNHDENHLGSRHSLYRCVYKIGGLYINFETIYAEKSLRFIFGCKVGQSFPIVMKLEVDLWHHLLNICTKFRIDISKHVEKTRKTWKNPEHAKTIAKIPKIRFLKKKPELMSRSIQWVNYVPNLKDISWFMRPWLQKRRLNCFAL